MSVDAKTGARVLVVEDEAYVRESIVDLLRSRGFSPSGADGVPAALRMLERAPVDVVLTDLRMPGQTGLDLIRKIQASAPEVPVVVLTGHGSIAAAVECLRAGASDFILKPADPAALEIALQRALASRALKREVRYLRGALAVDERPLGASPAWMRAMAMVEAAARSAATVLLRGESGTGKELLARLIHRHSTRAVGPYVRVNCAAVPVEIWESEFFGHRKGSFTGAAADREGRFHLADGGTLFLDEVGDIPFELQPKLLRVLQEHEFERLGSPRTIRVDVRLVAATNADLAQKVADHQFRSDLYYRLNVFPLTIPPLRERREDIPLLVRYFAQKHARRMKKPIDTIPVKAMTTLSEYTWPGNVRELENFIERAVILSRGAELQVPLSELKQRPTPIATAALSSPVDGIATLEHAEREHIVRALGEADWVVGGPTGAAARLGMKRTTLQSRMRKLGITRHS